MKSIPVKIKASSGITVEIQGKFYKFSLEEEREVPKDCDIDQEIKELFDHCNQKVDDQVMEIQNVYEGGKK